MKEQFYYFDDSDYIAVGPFASYGEAQAGVESDANHLLTYTIVKKVAVSSPPSLKRRWSA